MPGITVWLDGENIEITGTIDPGILLMPSSLAHSPSGRVRGLSMG
jgi:hypothetical protein